MEPDCKTPVPRLEQDQFPPSRDGLRPGRRRPGSSGRRFDPAGRRFVVSLSAVLGLWTVIVLIDTSALGKGMMSDVVYDKPSAVEWLRGDGSSWTFTLIASGALWACTVAFVLVKRRLPVWVVVASLVGQSWIVLANTWDVYSAARDWGVTSDVGGIIRQRVEICLALLAASAAVAGLAAHRRRHS